MQSPIMRSPRAGTLLPVMAGWMVAGVLIASGPTAGASRGTGAEVQSEPATVVESEYPLEDEYGPYRLVKIPRAEGRIVDEEQKLVKFGRVFPLSVESWDDEYFYFRERPRRELPPAEAVDEVRQAEIAAAYDFELEEIDRLELIPFERGLPNQGQWRNGFEVVDMNDDGHLDLVFPPPRKMGRSPVIFLGDGMGSWQLWDTFFPRGPWDYGDVAVADFNRDGQQDLAVAMHQTGVTAVIGDGQGNFVYWSEGLPLVPPHADREKEAFFTSRTLAAGDWNRDGWPDLVAVSEGATSPDSAGHRLVVGKAVLLNQGNGSWVVTGVDDPRDRILGDELWLRDLDGDGWIDMTTDSRVLSNNFILSYGDGEGWEASRVDALRPNSRVKAAWPDDVDGDGQIDLVIAYLVAEGGTVRRGIDIAFNRGERSWSRRPLFVTDDALVNFTTLTGGDLDGDGRYDVVAATTAGELWLFAGTEDGWFEREISPELEPDPRHEYCESYRLRLVDLDRDGRDELVAAFAGEPGLEQMAAPAVNTSCRAEGAIRVWRAQDRPDGSGD